MNAHVTQSHVSFKKKKKYLILNKISSSRHPVSNKRNRIKEMNDGYQRRVITFLVVEKGSDVYERPFIPVANVRKNIHNQM